MKRTIHRRYRWYLIPAIFAGLALPVFLALRFYVVNLYSFSAAGIIAHKEHDLMIIAVLLMLLVIVPVLGLTIFFAWHYRAGNSHATYTPDWDHAKTDELIWWAIPFEIILVLAALTWTSTHELDPWKPLQSNVPPVTVEVVALNWKWLFIYPDLHIATVNELEIPEHTPINFKLTADAPMNSFWIPKLGGQIMAMTGMVTELHLMATEQGVFQGRSANFSGDGFAGMQFDTRSVSSSTFAAWVASVQSSGIPLDETAYNTLAQPSQYVPPTGYVLTDTTLFSKIVAKYRGVGSTMDGMMTTTTPRTTTTTTAAMNM